MDRRHSSAGKVGQQVAASEVGNSSAATADSSDPSASSNDSSKEIEQIDKIFYIYSEGSSDVIGPEGIEEICTDMGIYHTDIRVLIFAWLTKAKKQGYFTLEEWRRGLKALPMRVDNIYRLKKALSGMENEMVRPQIFRDFYSFSFRYNLTDDMQKFIDIDIACELLKIVLGFKFRSQADRLVEYLKNQQEYKALSMDHWMEILRFCNEINFPSLNNYDPSLAWPLLLDYFVEWMRQQQQP